MIDFNRMAREYAKHREVHPEVLKSLLANSGIGSSSKVLEVGCGTGNYIVALQEASGASCWGIDPSVEMLAQATKRRARIDLRLSSANRLDLPQDFFDLVFSVDVVHHVAGRLAYFQEA